MQPTHVCPVCHSETARLTFCTLYAFPVCAELCALTPDDLLFLEMVSYEN
jgi:hypothetical protein